MVFLDQAKTGWVPACSSARRNPSIQLEEQRWRKIAC
jgi:hypothetical protein